MKKAKKILTAAAALAMMLGMSACSNVKTEESAEKPAVEAETAAEEKKEETETQAEAKHSDILVAYFSATGNTRNVAEKIALQTGGDLYEIIPAVPYTDEDLKYSNDSCRANAEQQDKSLRPEIASEDISLEGYKTVYLGFPIWWGEEPRIMDTFAEKYSFEGITVIPFCTSGSSGIGSSGKNMEELAGSGTWLEGMRFSGNASVSEIQSWIDSLK